MNKTKHFIYESRGGGFVVNGIDVDLQFYITVVVCHEDKYIDVAELQIEKDGSIPAIGWFADLLSAGIAEEISEQRFRELLNESLDLGCKIDNAVGERFERFLKLDITSSAGIDVPSMAPVIEIPCDKQLIEELKGKIDVCEFGTVKRYFRNPGSEISQVMIVQHPYKLEEVGAYFVEPLAHVGLSVGGGIFTKGVVVAGVDDMDAVNEEFRPYTCLLDSIEDNEACEVLYLPPAYVVKFFRNES